MTVEEGPDTGRKFESDAVELKIGRGTDMDFALSGRDKWVSRRHFAIIRRGDTFLMTNLSDNKTTVNGILTEQILLNDNDLIKIGSETVIRFRLQEVSDREANPSLG